MRFATFFVALFLFTTAFAEKQTLTDKKGRKIEVEIEKANETDVWVKLANRKTVQIKRSLLIDDDQKVIDEWLKSALPQIKVDPKLARGLKKSDLTSWQKVQSLELSIDLENKDLNIGIEDAQVTVYLVGRAEWNKTIFKVLKVQSEKVEISKDDTTTVNFDKLKNYYSATRGFHALKYVVHVQRESDKKLIYLGSDNSVLSKRGSEIIELSEGDVVKSDYTTKLDASENLYYSQTVVQ